MQVERVMSAVEALNLRRIGLSYPQIAARLGIGVTTVHKQVLDALAATIRERDQLAADLIQIEIERLDVALLAIWPGVVNGDNAKIDRLLKIMERRAKLLGLDAPTKVEASGPDGGPIELGLDASKDHVLKLVERYAEKAAAQAAAAAAKES